LADTAALGEHIASLFIVEVCRVKMGSRRGGRWGSREGIRKWSRIQANENIY
jgi:hypothetical protein